MQVIEHGFGDTAAGGVLGDLPVLARAAAVWLLAEERGAEGNKAGLSMLEAAGLNAIEETNPKPTDKNVYR